MPVIKICQNVVGRVILQNKLNFCYVIESSHNVKSRLNEFGKNLAGRLEYMLDEILMWFLSTSNVTAEVTKINYYSVVVMNFMTTYRQSVYRKFLANAGDIRMQAVNSLKRTRVFAIIETLEQMKQQSSELRRLIPSQPLIFRTQILVVSEHGGIQGYEVINNIIVCLGSATASLKITPWPSWKRQVIKFNATSSILSLVSSSNLGTVGDFNFNFKTSFSVINPITMIPLVFDQVRSSSFKIGYLVRSSMYNHLESSEQDVQIEELLTVK